MKLKAIIITVAVLAVGVGATVAITQLPDKEEPTPPVNVEQSTENTSSTVPVSKPDTEATTEPITESTTESTTKPKDETTTAPKLNLLTENEIKEKVLNASKLYVDWVSYGRAVRYDFDSVITGQYDMPYYQVIPTRFATLNELEKELQKYFAEDIYKEMFEHNYMEKDGKWYVVCTIGQGANYGLKFAELDIVSNSETKCEFTITCHYHDVDEKETLQYTLELIDDKWIFTEFGGSFIWRSDETFKWM